jgi:predicted nucleic acid-binding Zn ribbon protein
MAGNAIEHHIEPHEYYCMVCGRKVLSFPHDEPMCNQCLMKTPEGERKLMTAKLTMWDKLPELLNALKPNKREPS